MGVGALSNGRRAGLVTRLGMAAVAAALVLAGCSSSPGGASSSSAAAGPSGDPIKVMTIADLNTNGSPFPNITQTASLYGSTINAQGGIHGRPLDVEICDSLGTPEGAGACARKAVDDGVVAVVGSFNFAPDSMIEVLEPAGVAYFGECCGLGTKEYQSKDAFPLGSHQMYGLGFAKRAAADGCKNINAVVIQGAESFIDIIKVAAKKVGLTINSTTVLPAAAQDYSPQVAQATKGNPDCLFMVVSEGPFIAWMPAFAASGSKARMYGPQGNFNQKVCTGFETVCEGDVVVGSYPDITTPGWADYRAALKAAGKDPASVNPDWNSMAGMGTWAAYSAFTQIVDTMPSDGINAKSFLAAASKATVNLSGKLPPIDFTKEWNCGPISHYFTRLFNHSVVYATFKNGVVTPLTTTPEDVANLVEPADCKG